MDHSRRPPAQSGVDNGRTGGNIRLQASGNAAASGQLCDLLAEPSGFAPSTSQEKETGMSHDDVDYYQRRAEEQIILAQKSRNTQAVQAHYQLASAYLDRIHGEGDVVTADGGD